MSKIIYCPNFADARTLFTVTTNYQENQDFCTPVNYFLAGVFVPLDFGYSIDLKLGTNIYNK